MSDLDRYYKDDKEIVGTSLAEKVITSCCKKIEEHKYLDLIDYFLPHLEDLISIFHDNLWLKYHKGKMLLLAKRYEEARNFIIPVVREKQTESWAWSLLGMSYQEQDIEKSICCLIRAIRVCSEENFITNVRFELSKLLKNKGLLREAKFEINKILNFKKEKGQKLQVDFSRVLEEDWYKLAESNVDNNELYNSYDGIENEIILDGLPWIHGILSGKNLKSEIAYIITTDNEENSVKFKINKILKGIELGTPVRVKKGKETGRTNIYALEIRDGEKWDIFKPEIGIIDGINIEKSLSHIIFENDRDCIMHHDKFPNAKNYPVGSFVMCKKRFRIINRENKTILLSCELTKETPSINLFRIVSGSFIDPQEEYRCSRYNDYDDVVDEDEDINSSNQENETTVFSFGFIEDPDDDMSKIYIHKSLVEMHHLKHGDNIECKIVSSRNKKGTKGWKAVVVKKI